MQASDIRRQITGSIVALGLASVAVVVCYFYVDRPVAFYVHRHQLDQFRIFQWLTYPPPFIQAWSPLIVVLIVVARAWGPRPRWQWTLVTACLTLIVADQFRTSLGDVCGRYWPETWFDNNPSLIGTGAYGFHPFQWVDDVGSFPSGHAARIVAFASVWWVAIPRWRLAWVVVCLPMLASLVAMDYHFVSDVIAGGALGGLVGTFAAQYALRSEA